MLFQYKCINDFNLDYLSYICANVQTLMLQAVSNLDFVSCQNAVHKVFAYLILVLECSEPLLSLLLLLCMNEFITFIMFLFSLRSAYRLTISIVFLILKLLRSD